MSNPSIHVFPATIVVFPTPLLDSGDDVVVHAQAVQPSPQRHTVGTAVVKIFGTG